MARPERYDPEQWRSMNEPEGQERIRTALIRYMQCYLDSAPEGGELERATEMLLILKKYFEQELRLAEEGGDLERSSKAEQVLRNVAPMIRYVRTDQEIEAGIAKLLAETDGPPFSPDEIKAGMESFRRKLSERG
jgi:hypothetical protein